MIWKVLVGLIRGIVNVAAALLPTWTPIDLSEATAGIAPHVGKFFALINWSDNYLPVKQAIAATGLILTLYVARAVYAAFVKVLTWLHILGGNGAV